VTEPNARRATGRQFTAIVVPWGLVAALWLYEVARPHLLHSCLQMPDPPPIDLLVAAGVAAVAGFTLYVGRWANGSVTAGVVVYGLALAFLAWPPITTLVLRYVPHC
jgi:hypothetical protein